MFCFCVTHCWIKVVEGRSTLERVGDSTIYSQKARKAESGGEADQGINVEQGLKKEGKVLTAEHGLTWRESEPRAVLVGSAEVWPPQSKVSLYILNHEEHCMLADNGTVTTGRSADLMKVLF